MLLQRVGQAHGYHFMLLRELAQGLFPARLANEVRHHKHRGAPAHRAGGGFQQLIQPGSADFLVFWPLLHGVNQLQHMPSAIAGGYHRVHTRAVQKRANPVAVAGEQACQHGYKSG